MVVNVGLLSLGEVTTETAVFVHSCGEGADELVQLPERLVELEGQAGFVQELGKLGK